MTEILVGLVGFGYWGRKLFHEFSADPRFRITKVVVRHPEALIGELEASLLTDDLEAIVSDKKIRAVVVATPVHTHYEIGKPVIDSNKDLFIEKPLAATGPEARELEQIAKTSGCKVLVDYTFSFLPAIDAMKRLVEDEGIGALEGAHLSMRQLGRFNYNDVYTLLGSHMLAVLDRISPIRLMSFRREDIVVRDGIVEGGIIFFQGSSASSSTFRGMIQLSLNHPEKERKIFLYGDKGTISCDLMGHEPLTLIRYSVCRDISDQPLYLESRSYPEFLNGKGLQHAISAFYELLVGNKESNLASAVAINEILEILVGAGRNQTV